jgi:polar amino acid transport system substrate-binding protein
LRKIVFIFFLIFSSVIKADDSYVPLDVGVSFSSPPFIMHSSNGVFWGFDINMMTYICKAIHRECRFHSMAFRDLIKNVQNNKLDMALGAMTIIPERDRVVRFSNPYLMSYSRFLGLSTDKDKQFSGKLFENKKIGVKKGAVFIKQLKELHIKNSNIIEFTQENEQIYALIKNKIDFVLMDNSTALYWQNNSDNALAVLGKPMKYGYGYGIAMNKKDAALTRSVNKVLINYHKSLPFIQNYQTYFNKF